MEETKNITEIISDIKEIKSLLQGQRPIRLIRARGLQEKLGVKQSSLYTTYIKDKTFPKATKIGGQNAWDENEIDDWLRKQQITAH